MSASRGFGLVLLPAFPSILFFFLLVLGFLLKPSLVISFCAFVHLLVSVLTAKSLSSGNITSGGVFGPPVNLEKKKICSEEGCAVCGEHELVGL